MNYCDRLSPWCIVQLFPDLQHREIIRFRRRNDAREHLQILQRLNREGHYEMIFDVGIAQEAERESLLEKAIFDRESEQLL